MSVQAAVPEVVWCPANIIEMNMPVTSSAEKPVGTVLVLDGHEHIEQVALLVAGGRSGDAALHDPLDQIHEARGGRRHDAGSSRWAAYGST